MNEGRTYQSHSQIPSSVNHIEVFLIVQLIDMKLTKTSITQFL